MIATFATYGHPNLGLEACEGGGYQQVIYTNTPLGGVFVYAAHRIAQRWLSWILLRVLAVCVLGLNGTVTFVDYNLTKTS